MLAKAVKRVDGMAEKRDCKLALNWVDVKVEKSAAAKVLSKAVR